MLTLYGRRSSINVQKVAWFIAELGLEHEHVQLGGTFGGLDRPEFLAMNPAGRVPVIDDGGVVVWESHAILRYLAASAGSGDFWSKEPARRASVESWMDWSQTRLQPDFIHGVFWGFYRTPESQRNAAAIADAITRTSQDFAMLDRLLANRPFVSGEVLGLADIPTGVLLYRYYTLDIERPALPNVEAWYERLQSRAAFREHAMVNYEEMRGHLNF
jgi:glutathione S-transferase